MTVALDCAAKLISVERLPSLFVPVITQKESFTPLSVAEIPKEVGAARQDEIPGMISTSKL